MIKTCNKTYLLSSACETPGTSAVPPTTRTACKYLRIFSSPPAARALLNIATSIGNLLASNAMSRLRLPEPVPAASPVPGLAAAVSGTASSAPTVEDGSGGVGAFDVASPSIGVSEADVTSDLAGAGVSDGKSLVCTTTAGVC